MTAHIDGAPAPAPTDDWQHYRVLIHHGSTDTRKGTKREYETLTLGEIFEMEPDGQPKDRATAILQSSYHAPDGRAHEAQERHGSFVCLCLDIDKGDKSLEDVATAVDAFTGEEVASLIYSSSSAAPDARKWRVMVPLEAPAPFPQWKGAMRAFFDFAQAWGLIVDQSLARAGQPVYLPNVPPSRRGADGRPKFYESERVDGRGLRMTDPGLAQWWQTWQVTQPAIGPSAQTEPDRLASALRQAAKAMSPSPPSPIERFNAANHIEDLLERYGYTPRPGVGGHWQSPLQTSDSYATQVRTGDDGRQYWISLSESDAATGVGHESQSGARHGDAFDLFCHYEHGGSMQAALAAWEAQECPQKDLQGHPVALDWGSLPESPPEPPFVIPEWLAAGVVTLLAAHGGVGKSHLSVYIAICLATGRHPFEPAGTIDRVKVILYSAEDSLLILQGRIVRYLKMLGVSGLDLDGWLEVLDATNSDNVLFGMNGITARFEWLRERATQTGAQVLVFDNASDGFSGNEIDRAQVRQFMTALRQVAPTVLLLAHVDAASSMADMETAKGYSGSTAWHNSARARWFMARDKKTDEVTLELKKTNYGRAGAQAILGWDETYAAFRVTQTLRQARKAEDHRGVLLGLLASAIDAGADVSPGATSVSSPFKVLQYMNGFPARLTQAEVNREVANWQALHLVEREKFKKASRHQGERLVLTDKGRALAVAPPVGTNPPGPLQALMKRAA